MRVIAVDPGTTESAWAVVESGGHVYSHSKECNGDLLRRLRAVEGHHLVVERIGSYGMPVGEEVFKTCYWSGRFLEAAAVRNDCLLMYRREVKLHLCGSPRANDAAIRQRIIDIYGPGRDKAIGTKKDPGPLYGVKADIWQAIALGLTFLGNPSAALRIES